MKKIALIQFRLKKEVIKHEIQNFLDKGQLKKEQLDIFNAITHNLDNININNYAGFIFGGTGEYSVASKSKDIIKIKKNVSNLIKNIIKNDKLSLMVCFGFQLLAEELGELVINNKKKLEVGTLKMFLTDEGKNDKLFSNISSEFYSQTGHNDSILNLPTNCILLAYNNTCKIQSYRLKNNIYATQFHPEHDKVDLIKRLNFYPNYKRENIVLLNSKEVTKIVKNFINLCLL